MAKIVLAELNIDIQAMLKSASEVKVAIDKLKANQKELAAEGDTSSKQFVQNAADLKRLGSEYSANVKALSDNTKATQDNANRTELLALALNKEVSSIAEAREQNKLLNKLRNETNLTTQEGADDVLALNKALDLNNDFIKENADAYLKQKIGIGNYTEGILEAYKVLEDQKKSLIENKVALKQQIEQTEKGSVTYNIYNTQLNTLNQQINNLNQEMKSAEGSSKGFNDGMEQLKSGFQGITSGSVTVKEGVSGITSGLLTATKASIAFIATPLGAALAIIAAVVATVVGAFKFMTASMNSTEAGSQKLAKVTAAVSGVFQGLFMVIKPLGEYLGSVFIKTFELASAAADKSIKIISKGLKLLGFDDAAKSVDAFSKAVSDGSKAAVELSKAEDKLAESQRNARRIQLDFQKLAEKQRQIRDDESLSIAERTKANERLGVVLRNQSNAEMAIANQQLLVSNLRIKAEGKSTEALNQRAEALLNISDIQERITGQESEQLVNINSLRKESADKAKESLDKIIAARKLVSDKAKEDETTEIERLKTFNDKKKQLENDLALNKAKDETERSALKLTQDLEAHLAELELIKLNENEKNELKKSIIEQYNLDVQVLTDRAATEAAQKQAAFDIQKIDYEKQKNDIQLGLAQQLGNGLLSILGDSLGAQLAAIALDAIIQIVKLKIATSAAQQINAANGVALSIPTFGASVIAATATNLALGASSKLQQAAILGSAAISGGIAVAKKFEKGGIQEVGGNRHSQGGTKFYGEDGTTFEAERGEGIGVLNRGAYASFMDFNNSNGGGKSTPNFMAGGGIITQGVQSMNNNIDVNALMDAIQNMPAPIIDIQEFIRKSNNMARVVNGADF
jgi:hypothetical protein